MGKTTCAGLLCVALLAACGRSGQEAPSPARLSHISGGVYVPVSGAMIDLYRPGDDLRGPPFSQLGPLGPAADFAVDLPAGDYLFVARKRKNAEETGPIREGDTKSDPVRVHVEAGKPLTLNLTAFVKEGNPKERLGTDEGAKAGISGQVTDPEGKPVAGVRVHVYDHVQMSERPKFVSAKTGPDGRFDVKVAKGGTYYLCARDKYGGPPKVGDLYGRYDKGTVEPSSVIVPEGDMAKGIDITVHTVW